MTTAVHWHVDNIDDALAADFDGSLSGLGIELGTSSFNMSEALMALPTLKNEHHHHHHHRHHTNGLNSESPHHLLHYNHHSNSSLKSSNSELSSLSLNHSSPDDSRPIAVVHGKKNRLAYGQDEENVSGTIKRFCFSNERESNNSDSIRYIFAAHGLLQRESDFDCNHEECSTELKCLQRHSSSAPDLRTTSTTSVLSLSGSSSPSATSNSSSVLTQILSVPHHNPFCSSSSTEQKSPHGTSKTSNEFQYLLGAATSIATKLHEETMTYLNQGQSYEIKLKKLGDLFEMRGKMLKSVIRIGFHERRLQYMERELISQWKQSRQSERIIEIDVPLSYGIFENQQNSQEINKCEFLWDPTKETGIFVKVNCISTEFTPKKHGGEKGVPFRLIIETHSYNSNIKISASTCLHAASCQIKVFKPKGADRKHKTDREKMSKRHQSEQDKYQPSYDCTAFTEYPLDSLNWNNNNSSSNSSSSKSNNESNSNNNSRNANSSPSGARSPSPLSPIALGTSKSELENEKLKSSLETSNETVNSVNSSNKTNSSNVNTIVSSVINTSLIKKSSLPEDKESEGITNTGVETILASDANSEETLAWLKLHRFDNYLKIFSNFSGADLLKMTKADLIQICGLTNGIRLFNALHVRTVRPKLTLYVCNPADEVFRAIYLENLTVSELKSKLGSIILCSNNCFITRICLQGPLAIRVLMTDDVVRNFPEESIFLVHFDKDGNEENAFEAIFKPYK